MPPGLAPDLQGSVDGYAPSASMYVDADGDGFGSGDPRSVIPGAGGHAWVGGDCDDADALVYPGAMEICGDGVRNGCDAPAQACRYEGFSSLDAASVVVTTESPDRPYLSAAAGLGDVDGDGLDDVMFGGRKHSYDHEYDGAAYLYSGRTTRTGLVLDDAQATIVGTQERHFLGEFVVRAGDVNGDGYADVLVGPGDTRSDPWLFYGPVSGRMLVSEADATLVTSQSAPVFAGVGDLNADGFDDLAFSRPADAVDAESSGYVYVSFGPVYGATPPESADATWQASRGITGVGIQLRSVGDVSGDGRDDLAMGARRMWTDAHGSEGGLFVTHDVGTGARSTIEADAIVYATGRKQYADTDFTGGDFDDDGYGDLLVGAVTHPDVGEPNGDVEQLVGGWIVLGPVIGDVSLDDSHATILAETGVEGMDGVSVASPGDMDGDGRDEAVFGFSEAGGWGAITVWYGPVAGGAHVYTDADGVLWGNTGWGSPGEPGQLDAAGDFNGDGLGDLVVSGLAWPPDPSGFVILGGNF